LIGNGSILATGDRNGALCEFYAPTLAPDHQLLRRPARIGLSLDGVLRWFDAGFDASFAPAGDAPIADLSLVAPDAGIEAWIETFADASLPLILRRIQITNRSERYHDARLYLHHDLALLPGSAEAAQRDPTTGGVLHFAGRRAVLVNLEGPEGPGAPIVSIASRAAAEAPGAADEAASSGRPGAGLSASGIVDSLLGVPIPLAPGASAMVTAWIAAARSIPEARAIDASFRRTGVASVVTRTRAYWNLWTSQGARDLSDLPEDVSALFAKSLVLLRLHQTPEGAILSGAESMPRDRARPEYRWCWVRDAAFAADVLGRAGYATAARNYFDFAARAARDAGALLPVLDATGAPAPASESTLRALDGPALHLWALARHFERERDAEFVAPHYADVVVATADRLASGLDAKTGLPLSLDLWDERWGAHASVAAAVRGGLRGAARLAACFGDAPRARVWMLAADSIARAMGRELYRPETGRFARSIEREGEDRRLDPTVDASLLWLGLFDDLEPEDPRVKATVDAVRTRLWVRTGVGGLARYEHDALGSVGTDLAEVPGNPWIACTLWLAQHAIRNARRVQDLEPARILLLWASARAEGNGALPEQLHPYRGETTSHSPSAVAHAWFVGTVLEYAERLRTLNRCDRCGEPAPARRERRRLPAPLPSLPGIVAHL